MMKKNRNTLKEHRKPRKIRINALTIWIALEIFALISIASVILIRQMYGEKAETVRNYTIPSEDVPDLSIEDIELPRDLTGDETVTKEAETAEAAAGSAEEAEDTETDDIAALLAGMDARQKVDALLITTPESLCDRVTVTIAGDIFKEAYRNDMVSGLMFKENNFKTETAGTQMLSDIHALSKELTGIDILISYRGEITDMARLAERGVNLYCFAPDAPDAPAITGSAIKNNIIPAFLVQLKDVINTEQTAGLYVAQTEDIQSTIDAINSGKTLLYMTENHKPLRDGLVQAVSYGTITPEAIDKAAGFALTVRRSQASLMQEAAGEGR